MVGPDILDGYIAGPNGEIDWIASDPDVDFAALSAQFDTAVMGRKTFLAALQHGGNGAMPGLDVVVFSRTLRSADYPAVSVVNSDPVETVVAQGGAWQGYLAVRWWMSLPHAPRGRLGRHG